MQEAIKTRALEIHDSFSIWNLSKIRRIINFMKRKGFNVLVFHENDIVDKVVYPGLLYDVKDFRNSYAIYSRIYRKIYDEKPTPFVFADEKLIFRDLLKVIIEEATRSGIEVYLQVKELSFPDRVLEYRPKLLKEGKVCPSDPFWWEEFLPAKYTELCENFQELAGVIVSTGTRESRASMAHNKCDCDRCKSLEFDDWQRKVVMAIYAPLKKNGKKLVVRDFTYYPEEQAGLEKAVSKLPEDIVISIKNTPQDFYPTFPNNPLIGRVEGHPQWVEYEVMGEYYGFGVAPCILVKDIQERVKHSLERGASGFTARVDWEALPNHSCFDTPNLLNLYGVACFTRNPDLSLRDVYREWLVEESLLIDDLSSEELEKCVDWIMEVLEKTWPIIRKSLYIKDFVFNTNSKIPINSDQADFIALEHHGLQKWFRERAADFVLDNYEKFVELVKEKDEAVEKAETLYKEFASSNLGLREEFYRTLLSLFDFLKVYTKMFKAAGKAYLTLKYLREGSDVCQFLDQLKVCVNESLAELKDCLRKICGYDFPIFRYPAKVLLSVERFECFYEDIRSKILKLLEDKSNI